MKKLYTSVMLLSIPFLLVSQEAENNFTYRHMKGHIGQDELVFDLMIKGTDVYGRSYLSTGKTGNGNEEVLSGKIDEYGIAELEAYRSDEFIGTYSGGLKKYFNGIYRPENSQYGENFELEDDYAQSIRFSGHLLSVDSALVDSADSPMASMDLSILLPESVDSNIFIREAVLKAFFGNSDFSSVPDDSILHTYSDIYFNKYIESNIDIHDGGHSFNWEMITSSSIGLNQKGIVCYRANSYGYTGGAHGMGISRFLTFDTKNKSQLSLEDIFIESYEGNLAALLEKKYREQMFMDKDQSLSDAGLFEEDIYASHNFWLTDESIGFFYNPYELAPYSMGSISISLHKDEIRHLLKEDSPVKRLGW